MQASKYAALGHAAPAARPKYVSYDDLLAPAPPIPAGEEEVAAKPGAAAAAGPAAAGDGFLVHAVEKRDTLMGLSLKYGVTISDIKFANDLPSENIAFLRTLRIPVRGGKAAAAARAPVGERDSERALVRKLAVTYRLSDAEATFYLEEAKWDYDAAEREYKKEAAFEAAHASDAAAAVAAATVVPAVAAATSARATASAASTAAASAGREARVIEDGVDADGDDDDAGVAMTLLTSAAASRDGSGKVASADAMAAGLVPTRSGGGDGSTARVSALNPRLVGGGGAAAAAADGAGGAAGASEGGLRKRTLPGSFL